MSKKTEQAVVRAAGRQRRQVCPDCGNTFLHAFVCTACGAQKLYDATLRTVQQQALNMRPVFDAAMRWIEHPGDARLRARLLSVCAHAKSLKGKR